MNLDDIVPFVLTRDEAANIGRTLDGLCWAKEVIVLDSGSSDSTQEIATRYPNVRWHYREFDSHSAQCNHVLTELCPESPWVRSLDADYVMPRQMVEEIELLKVADDVAGISSGFVYCIDGVALRGGIYPDRVVLFRPASAHYVQVGHTQVLRVPGDIVRLRSKLLHDDRKPVQYFLRNQRRYAALEVRWLWSQRWIDLPWSGRARRLLVIAPWLVPLIVLVARGGLLDGRAGLRYALERGWAESLLAWELGKKMLFRNSDQ